jgi:hypothetical protein
MTWRIGIYCNEWLGSIHDLIPEEERFTEDGELKVPIVCNGIRIVGLADGEYLMSDVLTTTDYFDFSPRSTKVPREFCKLHGWNKHQDFDLAWLSIEAALRPNSPLSKLRSFKTMPLIRAGSNASASGYCVTEIGLYRGATATAIWIWSSLSSSECAFRTAGQRDIGEIAAIIGSNECFKTEIEWSDLEIHGLNQSEGVFLAAACAFEEGAQAAARLLSKIRNEALQSFLHTACLDGEELSVMGEELLSYAVERGIDLDEIESTIPTRAKDLQGLRRSLKRFLAHLALERAKLLSDRNGRLAPFSTSIDKLVAAFGRTLGSSRYPGVGYVRPSPKVHSLRGFLTEYALVHGCLPTGLVTVPLQSIEGSNSAVMTTFEINLDSLLVDRV